MNNECIEDLEKAQSHDPRLKDNLYYNQLVKFAYIYSK